jgi:hypothetical protein
VFVAGTFFYLLVLKRIRPSDYYKIGFPIVGVVLAVITSLLLFNLSQTLLSVVGEAFFVLCQIHCRVTGSSSQAMAIAMALGWYLFLYDNYVALAAISHVHYGFYSFVNGYVQNLTDVFTFVLMYVNVRWRKHGLTCDCHIKDVGEMSRKCACTDAECCVHHDCVLKHGCIRSVRYLVLRENASVD